MQVVCLQTCEKRQFISMRKPWKKLPGLFLYCSYYIKGKVINRQLNSLRLSGLERFGLDRVFVDFSVSHIPVLTVYRQVLRLYLAHHSVAFFWAS
jgi:hypothetical protein